MAKSFKKIMLVLMTAVAFVLSSVVLLTGCGEDASPAKAVDFEGIVYDGSQLKWDAVSNAETYTVTIDGTSVKSYQAVYSYPSVSKTLAVTIVASNKNGDSAPVSKTFTRLDPVQGVTFDEETGRMSWNTVDGAASYLVNVNNVDHTVGTIEFIDFIYGQRNDIKIKALGPDNSYFSTWSQTFSKTYLGAPTADKIQYDGNTLSWTGNTSAVGYNVYIDGSLIQYTTSSSCLYDSRNVSFEVAIQAVGDGQRSFTSKIGDNKEFLFLGTVQNLTVEDGFLTWDSIPDAAYYLVKVNGMEKRVTETKYQLQAGTTQNVSIRPMAQQTTSSNFFSSYSDPQPFTILNAPTLKWNGDVSMDGTNQTGLYWDPVNGAVAGYKIKVVDPNRQENTYTTGANMPSYEASFQEVGEYVVSVQSVATDGSETFDSVYSTPISIVRLAAPTRQPSGFIVSDPEDITKGFTVNYNTSNASSASGYLLYRNGVATTISSTNNSMKVTQIIDGNVTENTRVTYKIQSIGSSLKSVGGKNMVFLSSLLANSLEFEITVQASPLNPTVENGSTILTWAQVVGAVNYSVNIDGVGNTISTPNFDLATIASSGEKYVKVCTKGNGSDVLPSNYSPVIRVNKLAAPSNIRVDYNTANGKLTCDVDSKAKGVSYIIQGSTTALDTDFIENIDKNVTTSSVVFLATADANYWNNADLKDIFYVSSSYSQAKTLTKIADVTNLAFTNTALTWSRPSNISANALVNYSIYDSYHNFTYDNTTTGASFDLTAFDAGDYAFQIRARGDGINYLNSEWSNIAQVKKLESPEVEIENNKYVFYAVASASQYTVYVDGTLKRTYDANGGIKFEFAPSFEVAGPHTVEFYAVGNAGDQTIDSKPTQKAISVQRIAPFTISYKYENPDDPNNGFGVNGKIKVTISNEPTYKSGYRYTITTADPQITTSNTYEYTPTFAGQYFIQVTAMGGVFNDDGSVYYMDSVPVGTTSDFITILTAPTQIEFKQTSIAWTASKDAVKYKVVINYKDGTSETLEVTAASVTLKGHLVTDVSSVEITAIGNSANGGKIYNSKTTVQTRA